MVENDKVIQELRNLAFESVINRDYEHASYYYYWLLKKIEESDNKDFNYENDRFYIFYYYVCSKISDTWIFKNHDAIFDSLLLLVQPDKINGILQKTTISQLTGLLITRLDDVKLVDNYCINLQYIKLKIERMIYGEYNPDRFNSDYNMVLSKDISDIIRIYRETDWNSYNSIIPRVFQFDYSQKIRERDDVISIISLFLPDYRSIGNLLFRLSSLFYLYGIAGCLLSVMNFLRKFLNGTLDFKSFKSDISDIRKILEIGLDIYPTNYQIVEAFEFLDKFDMETTTPLKYNYLKTSLQIFCSHGYLNEGSKLNDNRKYNEAEKCYNEGLNCSLIGDKSHLYYNLAKNYQDLLYESEYGDLNRNLYADNSIRCAQLSLFDNNLSLMKIFQLDRIIINDVYAKVRNSVQCFNLIGITHSKMNNNDAAITAYSSALSFWGNNHRPNSEIGDIYSNRAISYLRIKEYDKSIEDSQTALFHKPQKPVSALLNIAYCCFQKQNYDTALNYYDRILTISNDNIELGNTYHSMGLSYFNLDKHDDAIDCFKNALQHNNNDIINYKLIGQAYRKSGNIIEAEKFFLEAVNSKVIDAYFDLGDMFSGEKQNDKAKMYFNHYLAESRKRYYDSIRTYNDDFFKNSIFYKYKSINKFTFESLINNYVYLSDIADLNDPFDCRLIYEMNKNVYLREVFEDAGMPKIMSMSLRIEQDQLLWSHYADEHKGIRIGYSFTKQFLVNNNIIFSPVEYKNDVEINWMSPLLKITGVLSDGDNEKRYYEIRPGTDVDLLKSIIVKSKTWEYEKEVRLIAFEKDNKKYNNREDDLFKIQNITFGCRTPDDDIKTILTIFYNRYSNSAEFRIENNKFYNGGLALIEFFKLRRSKDYLFTLENDDVFSVESYLI